MSVARHRGCGVVLSLVVLLTVPGWAGAEECTSISGTTCRLSCAAGSAGCTYSRDRPACQGSCRTGSSTPQHDSCTSASGSTCTVVCDYGTLSIACSRDRARCSPRCSGGSLRQARWPAPPSVQLASLGPAADFLTQAPASAAAAAASSEVEMFVDLVADALWTSGASGRPSTIARRLHTDLGEKASSSDRRSVLESELGGDRLTLVIGTGAVGLARLLAAARPLVDSLVGSTPAAKERRRRFDRSVRERANSRLLISAPSGTVREPLRFGFTNIDCEGAHSFEVGVERAGWLRVYGSPIVEGVRMGENGEALLTLDLRDVPPGFYMARFTYRCLTCPPTCVLRKRFEDYYVRVE